MRIEDSKSAARFFYCAKASTADREAGLEGFKIKQQDESQNDGDPGGDNPRNRGARERANHHATVKPTELMRWLCRLVGHPGAMIMDPFAGSGSTGRGALLEGFNFIGFEQDPEYCKIADARILDILC
jgi:site-specific DNA-methyltransferase (adenine-specific)